MSATKTTTETRGTVYDRSKRVGVRVVRNVHSMIANFDNEFLSIGTAIVAGKAVEVASSDPRFWIVTSVPAASWMRPCPTKAS